MSPLFFTDWFGLSSLFLILERVTLNLRDLRGEELSSRAKYAELVMKVRQCPV
jgi:hypothetical protein